jgi:hypothetical protein
MLVTAIAICTALAATTVVEVGTSMGTAIALTLTITTAAEPAIVEAVIAVVHARVARRQLYQHQPQSMFLKEKKIQY